MTDLPNQTYTITQIANKLKLNPKTLRRWESAGKFIPQRTLGNQRRYTQNHLKVLKQIKSGKIIAQPTQPNDPLLNLNQAAQKLGVVPATIRRYVKSGQLKPTLDNQLNPKFATSTLNQFLPSAAPVLKEPSTQLKPASVPTHPSLPTTLPWLKSPQTQKAFVYFTLASIIISIGLLASQLFNRPDKIASPTVQELNLPNNVQLALPDVASFLSGQITIGTDTGTLSFLDEKGNLYAKNSALIENSVFTNSLQLLPSAEPEKQIGRQYVDQDSGNLMYFDGLDWITLSNNGPNSTMSLQDIYQNGSTLVAEDQDINLTLGNLVASNSATSLKINLDGPQSKFQINGGAGQELMTLDDDSVYPIVLHQPTQIIGNLYAPKFIDSDNQSFYLDPSSTTVSLSAAGDATISSTLTFSKYQDYLTNSTDNFLTFSSGLSIGGATNFYFNQDGNIKANKGEFSSSFTAKGTFQANSIIELGDGDDDITFNADDIIYSDFLSCTLTTNASGVLTCGSASSGDASTLDTLDSTQFLRSDTSDNFTSGTLTLASGTTLDIASGAALDVNGDLTIADTNIALDGATTTFTSTGDLTLDSGGGQVYLADGDTINIGGLTDTVYNAFSDSGTTSRSLASDNDLYIEGNLEIDSAAYFDSTLEVDGTLQADGTLDANGQVDLGDGGDTITLNGSSLTFTGLDCTGNSNGGALTANGSGVISCSDDDSGTGGEIGRWQENSGSISPINSTWDVLIGGTASDSADFAFLNVNSGTPTASFSGNLVLNANAVIQTTRNQTLTIGGATTGTIVLADSLVGLGSPNLSSLGTVTATTFTDGTAQITGGNGTGFIYLTVDNLALNGNALTSTSGDIDLSPVSGSNLDINVAGGGEIQLDGGLTDIGAGTYTLADGNNDLGVAGDLEINGTLQADGQLNLGDGGDTITLNGSSLTLTGFDCSGNTNGGVLTTDASGIVSCSDDEGGTYWTESAGTLYASNPTWDILFGGSATASAKFGFLNLSSGTPTASISANSGNNAAFLTGTGNLATTNMQTLTLGGSTTGDILFQSSGDTTNYLKLTSDGTDLTFTSTDLSNLTFTPTGNLIFDSTGNLIDINDATLDLSTQTVDITLNDAVDSLNFDSNTLSIDALNNNIGIGDTTPDGALEVSKEQVGKALVIFNQNSTDQDVMTASVSGVTVYRLNTIGYAFYERYADLADASYYFDPAATGISINIAGDVVIGGGEVLFTPTATPTTSSEGNVYYDSDTNHLFVYGDFGGSASWHRLAMDMTQYSANNAAVTNQSYLEVAHNQNTNDLSITAWFYDTIDSLWKKVTDKAASFNHDLQEDFNDTYTQKKKLTSFSIENTENNLGDGSDGALTLSGDTNFNTVDANSDSCADAAYHNLTALTANTATIADASTCIDANDEVLLINLQGASGANSNVGHYETLHVQSVAGQTVTFKTNKTNYYGSGATDDADLGTTEGTQRVMLQRIPQYTNVTTSTHALSPADWDGAKGGVLFFRATGTVTIDASGSIHANAKGFRGGAGDVDGGPSGESYEGNNGSGGNTTADGTCGGGEGDAQSITADGTTCTRGGGGGGGAETSGAGGAGGGGGGGYGGGGAGGGGGADGSGTGGAGGTAGASTDNTGEAGGGGGGANNSGGAAGGAGGDSDSAGSASTGAGGAVGSGSTTGQGGGAGGGIAGAASGAGGGGTYGDAPLANLFLGSGGGAGGGLTVNGGDGGDGGGIILVAANTLSVSGTISSTGATGGTGAHVDSGRGGGGAGGSVKLIGNTLTLGSDLVTAYGGAKVTPSVEGGGGGAGGVGRIAVYYGTSTSGTTAPTYDSNNLNYYPYAVFVSEEINTPQATAYGNLSWTESLDTNGQVTFQTRSGATSDSTDNSWEAWKPMTVSTHYLDLSNANDHTQWTDDAGGTGDSNNLTVADGDITRNVDYFEDNDETTVGNTTKLSSVGAADGYAEDTISSADLSTYDYLTAWVYATRSGNVLKIGMGETAGTEQEETITIDAPNTWQKIYWDISDITTSTDRDGITKLRFTLTNTNTTAYIDNIQAESPSANPFLTTSAGSAITSTANEYIQYRAILTTTNTLNKPTVSDVQLAYTNPISTYTIDADRIRTIGNVDYYTSTRVDTNEDTLDDLKSNRANKALTSVSLNGDFDPGSGQDGDITITGDVTINDTDSISGRSCADGGDAVNYNVSSMTQTTATLTSTPASGCLAVGDEILLINLQGDDSSYTNVGNYETLLIDSITNQTITFTTGKSKFYGTGENDDGLGTIEGTQRVMIQRIPHYEDVTISSGGSFHADDWDGAKGGVLFFRATGTVSIDGTSSINADGRGFRGGSGDSDGGPNGESYEGNNGSGGNTTSDGTLGGGEGDAQSITADGTQGTRGGGGGGGADFGGSGSGGAGGGGYGGGGGGGAGGGDGGGTGGVGGTAGASADNTGEAGGGGGGGISSGLGSGGAGGNSDSAGTAATGDGGAVGSGSTTGQGGGGSATNAGSGAGAGGGGTYGDSSLTDLFLGSGGGGGGGYLTNTGANGGDGGGIVFIAANTVSVSGSISSTGAAGGTPVIGDSGRGGGGAGGSVKLVGNTLTLGSDLVTAYGGAKTAPGAEGGGSGEGGVGRIAVYYLDASSGTTVPAASEAEVANYPYTTYISDEIPTPNAVEYNKVSWLADLSSYGMIQVQTRSGKSPNSTDGSWETWKPTVENTNYTTLNNMNTHADWTATNLDDKDNVGLARNVNFYEDEDEAVTTNMLHLGSVGAADGYVEDTITPTDLSDYDYLTAWVYSTRSGNLVKLGFGESTGTEQEETLYIDQANTWQKIYWDITDVDESLRDAVTQLRISILSENTTIYVDSFEAERLLNTPSGSTITSTPNQYLQYRVVLTTTNTAFRPKLYSIQAEWNNGFKVEQTDTNTVRLYNYSGETQQLRLDVIVFGADLAEWYTVNDDSIEAGDVVALTGQTDEFGVPILKKAAKPNNSQLIGAISTQAGQTLGIKADNRRLLGLSGRIPVKIDPLSPPLKAGDYLTVSSFNPGLAFKASPGDLAIGKAFQSWTPPTPIVGQDPNIDTVLMLIQQTQATPLLNLTAYKNYYLEKWGDSYYQLKDFSTNRIIEPVGLYSQALIANLEAGLITADKIISPTVETEVLATDFISPLTQGQITIQAPLVISPPASSSSNLALTVTGNASISGDLIANKLITNELIAGKIKASTIEGLKDRIVNLVNQYKQNTQTAETDSDSFPSASVSASLTQLDQPLPATDSGHLNLDSFNANSGFFSEYLAVLGQATITDLKITNTLNIDNQLLLASNSISTLSDTLYLQPSGIGAINFLSGLMTLNDSGQAIINGDFKVTGLAQINQLEANTIVANQLNTPELDDLTINIASQSAVSIYNAISKNQVAGIDASGSAKFSSLNLESSGTATISAGTNHIVVSTPSLTPQSQVITTFSSNYTPATKYWVKKEPALNQFTVLVNYPVNHDTSLDWLIIN